MSRVEFCFCSIGARRRRGTPLEHHLNGLLLAWKCEVVAVIFGPAALMQNHCKNNEGYVSGAGGAPSWSAMRIPWTPGGDARGRCGGRSEGGRREELFNHCQNDLKIHVRLPVGCVCE